MPFADTELLLNKTTLVFRIYQNPSNLTLFTLTQMIRLALKHRAITWDDLRKRGVTPSKLNCLEERLKRLPIAA